MSFLPEDLISNIWELIYLLCWFFKPFIDKLCATIRLLLV